jgi:hypothetical protein
MILMEFFVHLDLPLSASHNIATLPTFLPLVPRETFLVMTEKP